MDVVAAHRVDAVALLVDYVLVVEEELVRLHQLRLSLRQLVAGDLVLQDVRELQVVVAYRLPAKHYHRVRVHHVETHEPDLLLSHDVDYLPVASLRVQLLDGGAVGKCLVTDCVYEALPESATIGPPHGLAKLGEGLLPASLDVKALALPEVVPFERAAYDVDLFFLLRDAEVDAVIHHLSEGLELALGYVELYDLAAGHVGAPVEGFRLVPANDQYVLLIDDNDFPLADLAVIDLERGPP